MARVAVLGEAIVTGGYSLAGALVVPAENQAEVEASWSALPDDVAVVVLTARAAGYLGEAVHQDPHRLTVVIPP